MRSLKLTTSIVLYGEINCSKDIWLSWFNYSTKKLRAINAPANYIGIAGDAFNSGKILQLKRAEARLKKTLEKGEKLISMSLYSLPENFAQAVFDYDAYFERCKMNKSDQIILTLTESNISQLNIEDTIKELKQYIDLKSGEVFEMLNTESPQLYAVRINPASAYKSLKVIKTF